MPIRPPAIKWTELGKCLTGLAANDYSCGDWNVSGSDAEGTTDGTGRIPVIEGRRDDQGKLIRLK